MPRRARIRAAGVPVHVLQRGNNRNPCFFSDTDRSCYLSTLTWLATQFECRVHAYVLMTNHVHLLVTPSQMEGASRLMAGLNQRYGRYVNALYGRTGSLWEGRFKSSLVDSERYFLCCQRYIELNPVRAGMVQRPEDYGWSSYRGNALGAPDVLLTPHDTYRNLGVTDEQRRAAYRMLTIEATVLDEIRTAANAGYALGTEEFHANLAKQTGRRSCPGTNGRPRLNRPPDAGLVGA